LLKRIIYGVVAAVLVALVVLASRPKPLEVQTSTVSRGPLRLTVDEDGKTRVRERYTVPAPVAGTLSRVELRAGDPVEPGTVIARLLPLPSPLLDPRAREVAQQQLASTRDAQQQAQAAVTRAQSALELAKSTLARDRHLVETGTIGATELEQAETDARMKESDLQALRFAQQVAVHAITQAQAAVSRFDLKPGVGDSLDVTSPVHGRILHVLHEDAGPVTSGTAIVEVGDLESMEIVAQLLSQDAVSVRPGMPATLTHWDAAGGREIKARVRRVEPAGFTKLSALGVEEQRVNVLLDLEAPAGTSPLGDGFAVEVSILTWSADGVLEVPTSALFRENGGWAVFAVVDGRAKIRPTQIGHRGALRAEVTGGVAEGDVVVAHPGPSLKDGVAVKGATD
jgi:HlyD family secretion protein